MEDFEELQNWIQKISEEIDEKLWATTTAISGGQSKKTNQTSD